MTLATKPAIAIRLRLLADQMLDLGVDLDYYGGLAPYATYGREMVDMAYQAHRWAEEIEKEAP